MLQTGVSFSDELVINVSLYDETQNIVFHFALNSLTFIADFQDELETLECMSESFNLDKPEIN